MNAQDFRTAVPTKPTGRAPKFHMTQAVTCVKGGGGDMAAHPRRIGKSGHIKGVHLFRGDTQHHYTVVFADGGRDTVDERCLRRA